MTMPILCRRCYHADDNHGPIISIPTGPLSKRSHQVLPCRVPDCSCADYVGDPFVGTKENPVSPPIEQETEPSFPTGATKETGIALMAAGVVEMIEAGECDRFIERILAAAHNRKRELRGTWGFRKDRR